MAIQLLPCGVQLPGFLKEIILVKFFWGFLAWRFISVYVVHLFSSTDIAKGYYL